MLFPNAFTETIKEEYRAFRKSADHSIYAHNEVLYLKGNPGSGKTAGALDYCRLYPSTLYFSFANLDAALAPRVFAGRYPDVFRACVTWEDFFDQLYDYGIKTGSSRKVVGFYPSNRQGEIANEGKEILIVPIAIANSLGDLDFVVETLQLAGADRKNGMSGKTVQT